MTISEDSFILHCLKDTDPVTENNINEQYPRPRITQDEAIYQGKLK